MVKLNIAAILIVICYLTKSCWSLQCYSCNFCTEDQKSTPSTCPAHENMCAKFVITKESEGQKISAYLRTCIDTTAEGCDQRAKDLVNKMRNELSTTEQIMFDAQKPSVTCHTCTGDLCNSSSSVFPGISSLLGCLLVVKLVNSGIFA